MNKYAQCRDLDKLQPKVEKKFRAFLAEMKKIGEPMEAHETLRTAERQKYLRSIRASRVLVSNHQSGKAADLHFTTGAAFPPAGHARWKLAARIAKKHGIDCGGILWNWDWNHFQDDGSEKQKIELNEITKKALNAVIATNSAVWGNLPEEGRRAVEECNNKLREILK